MLCCYIVGVAVHQRMVYWALKPHNYKKVNNHSGRIWSWEMVMPPAQDSWVLTIVGISAWSLVECAQRWLHGSWPWDYQLLSFVDGQNNCFRRLRDLFHPFERCEYDNIDVVWSAKIGKSKKQRRPRAVLWKSLMPSLLWVGKVMYLSLSPEPTAIAIFIVSLWNVLY